MGESNPRGQHCFWKGHWRSLSDVYLVHGTWLRILCRNMSDGGSEISDTHSLGCSPHCMAAANIFCHQEKDGVCPPKNKRNLPLFHWTSWCVWTSKVTRKKWGEMNCSVYLLDEGEMNVGFPSNLRGKQNSLWLRRDGSTRSGLVWGRSHVPGGHVKRLR